MPEQATVPNEEPKPQDDGFLYDATLTLLDAIRGILVFTVGEATHRVTYPHVSSFSLGAIGRLRLPTHQDGFAFHIYADQRLRRAVELDQPLEGRWGWKVGGRELSAQAGLLPGHNGDVVRRDTQLIPFEVPREFLSFCQTRGLTAEAVLRAFVADLCELTSFFACPRED